MNIYLLRHTRVEVAPGLCYGQTDVPLAASFESEVAALAQKLPAEISQAGFFSSPLLRCAKLAQRLSGDNYIALPELMEINYGEWENRLWSGLEQQRMRHFLDNYLTTRAPGGESYGDLHLRAEKVWNMIQTKSESTSQNNLVLVTHAGVLAALLTHALQIPAERAFSFQFQPGSISQLSLVDGRVSLEYLNR